MVKDITDSPVGWKVFFSGCINPGLLLVGQISGQRPVIRRQRFCCRQVWLPV
jgi:hypothetical protein